MAKGTEIPADFGALVGWDHQDLGGERLMLRLQSTQTGSIGTGKPLDEFRYFMTKNQAVVLANYLYSISDRLPQAKRKKGWFR